MKYARSYPFLKYPTLASLYHRKDKTLTFCGTDSSNTMNLQSSTAKSLNAARLLVIRSVTVVGNTSRFSEFKSCLVCIKIRF